MTIWIDADSLPREAKAIIGRRASRSSPAQPLQAVFVANRKILLPPGNKVSTLLVPPGEGNADERLLTEAKPGDMIITRDIPLASRAVAAGIMTLNDRGERWTADTVRERLSVRDHMAALREAGLAAGLDKARSYGSKETRAFADALDRAISTAMRGDVT
ncbi:MAG: hypothetical protein A3J97_05925 [Spirochaetes bacterium RIFOXYC1_FULL_54_7]|nr:MAG: hypothetical protein A3J97_05925 [Spirochaetes bacterium RIFOXYC1_FULL_54_7]